MGTAEPPSGGYHQYSETSNGGSASYNSYDENQSGGRGGYASYGSSGQISDRYDPSGYDDEHRDGGRDR